MKKITVMTNILLSFISIILIIFLNLNGLENTVKEDNISSNNIDSIDDANCIARRKSETINIDDNNKENVTDNNSDNPNQVGSIYIDGTSISNVIMQSSDNDYYLNHAPDGSYDVLGSIFMDYRNNINDRKILIFGHNAEKLSGSPFHDLEKYTDYSFYKNHQYIDLTLNNEKSRWQIFSVMIVSNTTNKHMKINFTTAEWEEHISWMISNSIYDTGIDVGNNDRIITLQTCYYDVAETFLIISAKKV